MEMTWDRIKAVGKRLADSKDLDIAMETDGKLYVVFTRDEKQSVITKDVKGRTHRVTAKGLWELVCDCPDFLYNDHLNGGFCKHIMAVLEYRGHTPVLVKTLADQQVGYAHVGAVLEASRASNKDPELERKIKELY